jgi:acyl carrier protein
MGINGNIQQLLIEYVKENTYKDTSDLTFDTQLFTEGIFDSMGFVLLIDYLEDQFQITASDEDLVEENFESINAISAFIDRKKSALVQ